MTSSSRPVDQIPGDYQIEKRIGDEIIQHVKRLELPFKLDQLTEGQGNCFPIAIVQQCRRPEVMKTLPASIQQIVGLENGHSLLQIKVKKFIVESENPRICAFKLEYTQNVAIAVGLTWDEYWKKMI